MVDRNDRFLAGNLRRWDDDWLRPGWSDLDLEDLFPRRPDWEEGRAFVKRLSDGERLLVGRNTHDLEERHEVIGGTLLSWFRDYSCSRFDRWHLHEHNHSCVAWRRLIKPVAKS